MKKRIYRITSMLLAVFVAFGMICFNTGEVNAASRFETGFEKIVYVDQNPTVYVYDTKGKINEVKIYSVKSSNSGAAKVVKESWKDDTGKHTWYWLKTKKPGKATITIKYKNASGKKATMKKKITVKKYPNEIKKLTVLGKNVNLKKTDNKFFYSKKCKTTKPKIKMTLKKGWKIEYISAGAYKNGNYKKEVKVTKTMLKKGKAISFSKKYDNVYISVFMINSKGDRINYDISLYR